MLLQLVMPALLTIGVVSQVVDPNDPTVCDVCLGLSQPDCVNTTGCFWSDQRQTCGNTCDFPTEEECALVSSTNNECFAGCCRICKWLPGGLNTCIIKWDFHFDVCFVVDASQSILSQEWESILDFFIRAYIAAITPDACDISNPNALDFCPHVGVVQFDAIAQVIIPNLTEIEPYYTESSYCFRNDTILEHLKPDWQQTIAGMKRSIDQGRPGGNTWTLEGVQRCADLLLNTHLNDPKSLSLLVVMTDGSPNGPQRCAADVCDICGVNPEKVERLTGFAYDASCDPNIAGQPFSEMRQDDKLRISSTRKLLVYFKPESGAFKNFDKLDCILDPPPNRFDPILVPARLLQNRSDPTLQASIGTLVKNLSDTVCDFSNAPTQSPTVNPSQFPSKTPSQYPTTKSPSQSPSTTPTRAPTRTPSIAPTRLPTRSPSQMPSPSGSNNPTRFPMRVPTGRPTFSPSDIPTNSPTDEPTGLPSKTPTTSPSAQPTTDICRGPPPPFQRKKCDDEECLNSDGNIIIINNGLPSIEVDSEEFRTKFCYGIQVNTNSTANRCEVMDKTIRGVSFLMDECCPNDGDFLYEVSVNGFEFDEEWDLRKGECELVGDGEREGNDGCFRITRDCVRGNNDDCLVVNVNGLNYDGEANVLNFCFIVPGTNYNSQSLVRIDEDKRETGRICVENGRRDPFHPENICSCVDIEIVKSQIQCELTKGPTSSPTNAPTDCELGLPETPPLPLCEKKCGKYETSEWEASLALRKYDEYRDMTIFKYCIDIDEDWYQGSSACLLDGNTMAEDVSQITFRLDECCSLCLTRDHFYELPRRLDITNRALSAYFSMKRSNYYRRCFRLKMNGDVQAHQGLMCMEGGGKCDCIEILVPSSCDLKKWVNPTCRSNKKRWWWWWGKGGNGGR